MVVAGATSASRSAFGTACRRTPRIALLHSSLSRGSLLLRSANVRRIDTSLSDHYNEATRERRSLSKTLVRTMTLEDEAFVSTCSHVDESREIDAAAARRLLELRRLASRGAVIHVGLLNDKHVGFAHSLPIEASPPW